MTPKIEHNYSLKNLNSFGIDATADNYYSVSKEEELILFVKSGGLRNKKFLVLSGGSNILFTGDYNGLILHPVMDRISIHSEENDIVNIDCDSGVDWDEFVGYCVDKKLGGIENLSHIPGCVGAAPIQNIGAYGSEVKDSIVSVRAIEIETGDIRIFNNSECKFAYRNSIFKTELKGRYIISSVRFRLKKDPSDFNTSYGMVSERLNKKGEVSLQNIRNTIIEIRKEKLPDPDEIGNAGSFFKNPTLNLELFEKLQSQYEDLPSYPAENNMIKIPAAWLIEKCGWKGYRKGDAGVHKQQALVLVNYGKASGKEIFKLSEDILNSVFEKFGIRLEREVNII